VQIKHTRIGNLVHTAETERLRSLHPIDEKRPQAIFIMLFEPRHKEAVNVAGKTASVWQSNVASHSAGYV
jgi:hypothetical protein